MSKAVSEHILAIANDMGYEPVKYRPETERQHVRLVIFKAHGLVVMDTEFFAELIENLQMECEQAGLELLISHIHAMTDRGYRQRIQDFCNEECAGILLLGTEMNAEQLRLFSSCKSPLVVLDNRCRGEHFHSVVMNNFEAGYLATTALYEAGHRRIDHITSSMPFSNNRSRREGYENLMAEHGLSCGEQNMWYVTPSIEGAYLDMKKLLNSKARSLPTAFFAANDLMAIGSIRALSEAGYRVPEDISVIGMDDTAVCLACTPPLTTIRVYRKEMAIAAIRTLLHLSPVMTGNVVQSEVGVDLVMRGSVKRITP